MVSVSMSAPISDALKASEITYINAAGAFGSAEGQFIQRVRLPSECFKRRSRPH